jgi:hypothetical protein
LVVVRPLIGRRSSVSVTSLDNPTTLSDVFALRQN